MAPWLLKLRLERQKRFQMRCHSSRRKDKNYTEDDFSDSICRVPHNHEKPHSVHCQGLECKWQKNRPSPQEKKKHKPKGMWLQWQLLSLAMTIGDAKKVKAAPASSSERRDAHEISSPHQWAGRETRGRWRKKDPAEGATETWMWVATSTLRKEEGGNAKYLRRRRKKLRSDVL